ncbi:MAG: sulfurtransferase TusA family protein [Nitrososphaerota archaeon]|jgi:TusA-related sulfurtransferase|nr:sulfurtransferase TusA family protein [Nitrososphaerota archaeon]MDG6927907.1 sulfurtransferase TusA family protein [Nitrososphaerota archaeon]MDG6930108.1 sulfurtransferase TusA family protein [Nitrososphaerota archaeon]MDG6932551.1 sulfurtransferase TusA family protein [Nitrososphaerota archaeon]MDG6935276.1 sulfurtransferase TusA family protein [Nitrososphaerota archaeon]
MAERQKTVVDCRGTFCPGPLLQTIQAVKKAKNGDLIAVYSDDSGSKRDIPLWVQKNGHKLLSVNEREGFIEFLIEV